MLSIRTKKFFGAIPSKRLDEKGQTMLEYLLVLMVVVGMVFVLARPVFGSLQKKIGDSLKQGFFTEDPSGGKFYYFNVR